MPRGGGGPQSPLPCSSCCLSVCLLDHPALDLPPAARLGMDLAKWRTPGQLTKLLMRQSRLGVRAELHGHPLWQPRCAFGGGFLCKPMDFIPLGQLCGAPSPARAASRDDDGITVVPFPQLLSSFPAAVHLPPRSFSFLFSFQREQKKARRLQTKARQRQAERGAEPRLLC